MEINLKELLDKLIQEKSQPTEIDRINALESAITDLAIMIAGVKYND